MGRRRHVPGAPIGSAVAGKAHIRRAVAEAVDGKYRHPAGGTMRRCPDCNGLGRTVLDGFDGAKCMRCHGSGVVALKGGQ